MLKPFMLHSRDVIALLDAYHSQRMEMIRQGKKREASEAKDDFERVFAEYRRANQRALLARG